MAAAVDVGDVDLPHESILGSPVFWGHYRYLGGSEHVCKSLIFEFSFAALIETYRGM